MNRSTSLLGLGLAALAAVGCDDDPVDVPAPASIAATAAATADLSTLASSIEAAGLDGPLSGAGPFTVFAPRNAAFDALDDAVLAGLIADGNVDLLTRVLNFHVVVGAAVLSSDLTDGQTVTTAEGGTLTIGVSGGSVTVDGANVVSADIEASNGVVHVIDAVLVPSELDAYEKAVLTPGTTTLAEAILAAGLDDDLQAAGPFTVFAPVDAAFEALGEYPLLVLLDPANSELLSKVLTFHVVSGDVRAGDLVDGGTATTLQGGTLTFDLSDPGDPRVNGVSITTTDIEVGNGVIHLVDEVLMPELTVVEQARLTSAAATLVQAITAAELVDDLSAAGPFTVFAPANGAFEDIGATTVQALLDAENQPLLRDLLRFHVVAGDIRAADLTDGQTATTLEGGEVTFDLSDPSQPKINGASITITDVAAGNGVIHVIDRVLTESLDIVERASVTDVVSALAGAVEAADLGATLGGAGPFTLFAPVDEAFEALGTDRLDVILDPANQDLLQKILTYHVVPGDIRAADLTDGLTVATVEGTEVSFDLTDPSSPKVNGADIYETDIVTENGVIHLIGDVLVDNLDIVDVATVEGFPTLVSLVEQQGLTTTLRGDNGGDGYTVFAPTEDAFAGLDAVPTGQALTDVLTYHVVSGTIGSADLTDGQTVQTLLSGGELTVNVDVGTGAVTITDGSGNTVAVTAADVSAANGVIHVIDGVLLPGS